MTGKLLLYIGTILYLMSYIYSMFFQSDDEQRIEVEKAKYLALINFKTCIRWIASVEIAIDLVFTSLTIKTHENILSKYPFSSLFIGILASIIISFVFHRIIFRRLIR